MIELLKSILIIAYTILEVFLPILLLASLPHIIEFISCYFKYKKSNYKYESGDNFLKFYFNKGTLGEGLIYIELEKLNNYGKIMTNLYFPTEDGITKLDLLYISSNGIYVIESKNYSGWIFGSEDSNNWTMAFYNYKKIFFNPIWQNKKNITCLSQIVDVPLHSLIVFSEHCKLKELNYDYNSTKILNRQNLVDYLREELNKERILSDTKIDETYESLKAYQLRTKQKNITV